MFHAVYRPWKIPPHFSPNWGPSEESEVWKILTWLDRWQADANWWGNRVINWLAARMSSELQKLFWISLYFTSDQINNLGMPHWAKCAKFVEISVIFNDLSFFKKIKFLTIESLNASHLYIISCKNWTIYHTNMVDASFYSVWKDI